jgi:hypothetical protein
MPSRLAKPFRLVAWVTRLHGMSDDAEALTPESPVTQPAPVTGNAQVDAVLAAAGDLDSASVAERLEKLGDMQEKLQAILNGSRDGGIPVPAPEVD